MFSCFKFNFPFFRSSSDETKSALIKKISSKERRNLLQHFPRGLVAIDTETTGLSPLFDKIIEIALIKIDPSGEIHTFESLVNPGIEILAESTRIHGITNEMVRLSPTFDQIFPQVLQFLDSLPIIAHNAVFDIGHLIAYCKMNQIALTHNNAIYDSCKMSRKVLAGKLKSFKLQKLAEYYSISLNTKHRAFEDTYLCLRIVAKMLESKANYKIDREFFLGDYRDLNSLTLPSHLEIFKTLSPHQEVVIIEYKGKSISQPTRPVQFASVLPLPSGIYLYALCLISNQYKFFSLKKIKSVQLLSNEKQNELKLQYKKEKEKNEAT